VSDGSDQRSRVLTTDAFGAAKAVGVEAELALGAIAVLTTFAVSGLALLLPIVVHVEALHVIDAVEARQTGPDSAAFSASLIVLLAADALDALGIGQTGRAKGLLLTLPIAIAVDIDADLE
jgi:hypothetical protein